MIRAAVAECDTKTARLRPLTDPIKIVCAARAGIVDLKYPNPEPEQQAARLVACHSKSIDELISNGGDLSTIKRAVAEMEAACRRLTIPEKASSLQAEMHRMQPIFQRASWSAAEIDGLKGFFRNGDRISSVTISSVKLGDREILRADVRKGLKGLLTNAQLDEFERRERDALQLEAENAERRGRGEASIHRQY